MKIRTVIQAGQLIAVVEPADQLIHDAPSALDLFMTIRFDVHTSRIALDKAVLTDEFFDLSTRLAGEVLQKVINYQLRLAIYGDFSGYKSRALQDFIYESNKGNHIFFQPTLEAAIGKLCQIP